MWHQLYDFAVTASTMVSSALAMNYRIRNSRAMALASDACKTVQDIRRDYVELHAQWERVQHGYDQGVLEGTRQGYANVRAFLADNMENSPPRERAFLVTWLHPRLSTLGEMEHKLLMDMKGLAEQEKEFKKTTASQLGIEEEDNAGS